MKIEKMKKWIKNHKGIILDVTGFVGAGIIVYTVGHNIGNRKGLKKGCELGVIAMACAEYADRDGTSMMVDKWLENATDSQLREVIETGKEVIRLGE